MQLPVQGHSYISYDEHISGLRAMRSTPTHLESTMHIVAWGRDIYYTVFTPSLDFDRLDEGFSFLLLGLALLAMFVAVVAMNLLVKRARLKVKWK
jgi:hypothetical protein